MISYLARLSGRQHVWLAATLIAMVMMVAVGWAVESPPEDVDAMSLSPSSSIRQIAPKVGTTGFALAKELDLARDVDKDKALAELEIDQEQLDRAAAHFLSHRGRLLKYFVFGALVLFGRVFLIRLGRPDGSPNSERKTWYPRAPYIAVLLLSVAVCGFALGKSPNPMEGTVKFFKAMVGLQPSISATALAFLFFIMLAIVGNKLVCGWACPFGALQELLYSLPMLNRLKRWKVPFFVSNPIRGGFFLLVLLLLFGIVGGTKELVVYHFVNPFNLFDLSFETLSILLTVLIVSGLSPVVYRPFCQFICPFGFVSWLVERFSLAGVRIDPARCNQCGACSQVCPSGAAEHMISGKRLRADCYSCARCMNVCPQEALSYRCVIAERVTKGVMSSDTSVTSSSKPHSSKTPPLTIL